MWDDNANFSVTKYDHLQMKVVISENARVVAERKVSGKGDQMQIKFTDNFIDLTQQ